MVRGEERLDIKDMCKAGMSVAEIHRRTGRDPKTIRRIRTQAEPVRESVAEPARPSKLDPFKVYVLERMKQRVFNAVRIHRELADAGYDGGITILRDFMAPHRPVYRAKVTPRFETELGRQAQVDVGHFTYRNPEGRLRKTYCLAMVLGYSRMLYVEFLPRPGQMEILKAIRNAFDYLGGVPHEILSDNASSLVRKAATKDRSVEWSETYLDFARHFGFVPRACRAYWARGKGKIERFWRTVDSSFLPELKARPANSLEELNALFGAWLEQGYHHWANRETGETPAARFARGMADIRLPDPVRLAEAFLWREDRRVDKTGQVPLQGNRYEVDPRLARRRVQLRYDPFNLSTIQVWCDGQRFDDARPYDLVREHDQRVRPRNQDQMALPATGLSYLDLLLGKHEAEAREALGRIAFHRARPDKEDESDV